MTKYKYGKETVLLQALFLLEVSSQEKRPTDMRIFAEFWEIEGRNVDRLSVQACSIWRPPSEDDIS